MIHHKTYRNNHSQEWVTFVHGAGGSSSIWFQQLKAFRSKYNVLLLDLRGHGRSKFKVKEVLDKKYTFDFITADIIEVMDHLQIEKSHFVGISLGTILIRNLAELHPDRVHSMILGGAIMKLNVKSQILMKLGVIFKSVIPYMLLYKLFAFIIMPRKNHRESRLLFIREAKKLYQREFIRWFKLSAEVNPLLKFFREKDSTIPSLYIMGEQDHLFLPSIRKIVSSHNSAELNVINDCGHVVNVEQASEFNHRSLTFLKSV